MFEPISVFAEDPPHDMRGFWLVWPNLPQQHYQVRASCIYDLGDVWTPADRGEWAPRQIPQLDYETAFFTIVCGFQIVWAAAIRYEFSIIPGGKNEH